MINERVNEIMCDYVSKASDFCQSYEKEVLSKQYGCLSSVIESIYSELESKLWSFSDEAKHKLEIEIKITSDNYARDIAELKDVENDLITMSRYYRHMYSARIAEGLAKQWRLVASKNVLRLLTNDLKRNIVTGGTDNGEH